jgi:nucleotide-binding universal stress UspA family protein
MMFSEIIACLDGSSLAEKILPLAHAMSAPKGKRVTLLRVVQDTAELETEEGYLRDCARQYSAELRFVIAPDPGAAIGAELKRNPRSIAALTTHGRTAWTEAILGSVALRVIREARRPVIVFRPPDIDVEVPKKISTVAVALDGSDFSEKMLHHAINAAQSLAARLLLLQVLPVSVNLSSLQGPEKSDIIESSYLHRKAAEIKSAHDIEPQWEVLHGEPADALCRYLSGMTETILAMTTHARSGVQRVVLGSVAASCVRHAGVPLLLYWPH